MLFLSMQRRQKRVVTVEDHSVIGGLGAAVAQVTSAKCPAVVRTVGVQDRFA
ncbi:MAG: transketolase C-terminal domain-containing protein [Ruminococcus sp.]